MDKIEDEKNSSKYEHGEDNNTADNALEAYGSQNSRGKSFKGHKDEFSTTYQVEQKKLLNKDGEKDALNQTMQATSKKENMSHFEKEL